MTPTTADQRIADFLSGLASRQMTPGCGSAVALVMALAAGCAQKALAITEKHSPDDARLADLQARLDGAWRRALEQADRDAELFADFLNCTGEEARRRLLRSDESAQNLAREIRALVDEGRDLARDAMSADVLAADLLLIAAMDIQRCIREENERAG